MRRILNVSDARRAARRRLPRGLFEYVDRGAEDEVSLRANRAALDTIRLVPNTLRDVSGRTATATIFGQRQPTPLVIAPTAAAGLVWYDGEVELAKAAAQAGIPFCVSTQSMTSVEDIARGSGARLWFQLYVWKNRARTLALIDRARDAGAEALVLTVDTAASPNREYNLRNGFGIPIRPSVRAAVDAMAHPAWFHEVFLRYLRTTGVPTYAHYPPEYRTPLGREVLADEIALADDLTWDDVRLLRERWRGRLVLKGVLSVADAQRAAAIGADGIVVSNHGGRMIDSAVGPTDVLPRIAAEVGSRLTVLADSGVRRGSDVARFLALGAEAVMVGRAPLYGMAHAGSAGAGVVLELLRAELITTMALLGVTTIGEIAHTLHRP